MFVNSGHCDTVIVNLTSGDVFVAGINRHVPRGPGSGPPYNTFDGWLRIIPGRSGHFSSGYLHLQDAQGKDIEFPGLRVQNGLVKEREEFHARVPSGDKNSVEREFRELLSQGFRVTPYQQFKDEPYFIQGDAFRVEQRTERFGFSSRNQKSRTQTFPVPGTIVFHRVQVLDDQGAQKMAWRANENKLTVSATTAGNSEIIDADDRYPVGNYKGTVTIWFTNPRAAGPVGGANEPLVHRLKNGWLADGNGRRPDQYIHLENGRLEAGPVNPGWLSARWRIDTVAGPDNRKVHHIRNASKPELYLHVERGQLECGPIQPGWHSALWEFEPIDNSTVRVRNLWRREMYLHMQTGQLSAGPINKDWHSARWILERP